MGMLCRQIINLSKKSFPSHFIIIIIFLILGVFCVSVILKTNSWNMMFAIKIKKFVLPGRPTKYPTTAISKGACQRKTFKIFPAS